MTNIYGLANHAAAVKDKPKTATHITFESYLMCMDRIESGSLGAVPMKFCSTEMSVVDRRDRARTCCAIHSMAI